MGHRATITERARDDEQDAIVRFIRQKADWLAKLSNDALLPGESQMRNAVRAAALRDIAAEIARGDYNLPE